MNKKHYLPARRSAVKNELLSSFDSFFDSFFEDVFPHSSSSIRRDVIEKGSYPKINAVDLEDKVIIDAAVPGMKKKDISVEIDNTGMLTLSGKANQIEEYKDKYIKREIKQSSFSRSFYLGDNLDPDTIKAKCENGILQIVIDKISSEDKGPKTRKVDIK